MICYHDVKKWRLPISDFFQLFFFPESTCPQLYKNVYISKSQFSSYRAASNPLKRRIVYFCLRFSIATLRGLAMHLRQPHSPIETHVKLRSPCARSDSVNFNPRDVPLEYDFHFCLDSAVALDFVLMSISFGLNLA